jgi:hypothetical protein
LVDEDEPNLLTSPIERTALNRFFVFGGPLGLLVGIMLSLWVHGRHVTHGLTVQVDPQWIAGAPQAVRVQIVAEGGGAIDGEMHGETGVRTSGGEMSAEFAVRRGGADVVSGSLLPVGTGGIAQGRVDVPAMEAGPAELVVHARAGESVRFEETVAVEVVTERERRRGEPMQSSSMSQYADDSDPQPEGHRIVVRPDGRLLASFDVALYVRVTAPDGRPWIGALEVRLADGEMLGKVGDPEAPVLLSAGTTDALGLFALEGPLESEVLRVEVRLLDDVDPGKVVAKRRVRLVSFAGAVTVAAEPRTVPPGGELEVAAFGLSAARPVFVDVHGPDGAWVDTFTPIRGREPPRAIVLPDRGEGLYALEAYHFTNDPGESTALARVEVVSGGARADLARLVEEHLSEIDTPRRESGFDRDLERKWLAQVKAATLDPSTRAHARRMLLGTLPPRVLGPPLSLSTRDRDREALAVWKARWIVGLRIYMIGGGALFLVAITALMLRAHGKGARDTLDELAEHEADEGREALIAHVSRARRDALLRGLGILAIMAGGLVTTVLLLEKLLWQT